MLARFFFAALGLVLFNAASANARPRDYLKKPDVWFSGSEAERIGRNILSFQSNLGGWPKNEDTTAEPFTGDRSRIKSTYDNGASTDELRFLARIYKVTNKPLYRKAFDSGLDYVLKGQYSNGGWPQYYPPGKGYHRHITFNDDAMVRLLQFVREVANSDDFAFVDLRRREASALAFTRGIECILKCQIWVNGVLTGWCAQHDEIDFGPQSARSFELATLSGAESVGITRLLMSIEDPSPEIAKSVEAAIAWFEQVKLTGISVVEVQDENGPQGVNKIVVPDPDASALWARFYVIETNAPVFVDRDGIPKAALSDIGYERRNGYAWYGTWPHKLLDVEYPRWKEQIEAAAKDSNIR